MSATTSDWRASVIDKYREQRVKNKRTKTVFGRDLRPIQLTATIKFVRFIDRAAKNRNVNRSTYYRRAVAVLAAADLGIDVRTILWESPKPGGYGEHRFRGDVAGVRDDGTDIEAWCPHPGCAGEHLQPRR